ncbi:MAG TPA: DMT family transporter [Thermoplasmata archaeon]|nr:DMT family transporter [Thermoplasmata archaeon]
MREETDRSSLVLLVALGAAWGSAFIAIRYLLDLGASPFFFVLIRLLAQAGLTGAIAVAARERGPSRRDAWISAILGGAFVMGGYQLLLFWGEQYTSGGLAGVLVAASPLFTALLSVLLLRREAFHRIGTLGVIVGFAGVAFLFEPDLAGGGPSSVEGLAAILSAAFAFALGSVLLRRWRRGGESLWGVSIEFAAGGLVALAAVALFEPAPSFPLGPGALLAVAYLVVVAGVLGFLVYFHIHGRVGPGRANLVSFVAPVAALVSGVVVLGESYALVQLGGFGLIVLGLYLVQRDRAGG